MLEIKNLKFSYNGKYILNDINLFIDYGELVTILGPNGAGKTTLLKIIVGLLKPKGGYIKIMGRRPEMCRGMFSYIPQEFKVENPLITVDEFLKASCGRMNFNILKEFGVIDFIKERLSRISYGQLRKVLISIAFSKDSKLYVFDEPTNGLDYYSKRKFYEILSQKISEGKSCILVSHDIEFVSKISERIYYLKEGKLIRVRI